MPLVAVLGARDHAAASTGAVALALTRALGTGTALAGVAGASRRQPPLGGLPAARRTAARLRERGLPATTAGRLVWLGIDVDEHDDVGLAAAMAATLGRAASAARVPAALALPLARTEALDRMLGWHDAFVVVREPAAADVVVERALVSLARLGRPVATMPPPSGLAATLAAAGLGVGAGGAAEAVARLGLGDDGSRPRA
jgi:hypothetical protein